MTLGACAQRVTHAERPIDYALGRAVRAADLHRLAHHGYWLHRVVHDYGHVDPDIVWDTVQEDVPPILREPKKILSDMRSDAF